MSSSFVCEAFYYGCGPADGPQSPATITTLVHEIMELRNAEIRRKNAKKQYGQPCQLQCNDDRIKVSKHHSDEGFESDSESSGSCCCESCCSTNDIKVIKDHVLRLEKLIQNDSSSPSDDVVSSSSSMLSTSGAESEEDDATKSVGSDDNSVSADKKLNCCSKKFTKTNDRPKSSSWETNFMLNDILFCHVSSVYPQTVVLVVKTPGSSQVLGHVFHCVSETSTKALYSYYYAASNQFKLNRYRNSKRRSSNNKKVDNVTGSEGVNFNNHTRQDSLRSLDACVYQSHLDTDVREPTSLDYSHSWNIPQTRDKNGVIHIEIESAPCSLLNSVTESNHGSSIISVSTPDAMSFVHSVNNRYKPTLSSSFHGGSSSCYKNAPTNGLREEFESNGGNKMCPKQADNYLPYREKKAPQRENNKKHKRNRDENEENKIICKDGSRKMEPKSKIVKEVSFSYHEPRKQHLTENNFHSNMRNLRSKEMATKNKEQKPKNGTSYERGPAPLPPPRRHPNNPSLLLVPTKSGQEITRSLYPKEVHTTRGNKNFRVDYSAYPSWGCAPDINNNPNKYGYYSNAPWFGSHEYHLAGRSREPTVNLEMRRRSRSKSPARRPMAHRYIDAMSTFSISQKLKDISDAVFTNKKNVFEANSLPRDKGSKVAATESKSHILSSENSSSLKPVIKKGKNCEECSTPEPRRVTFSAYATVQVLDL